MRKVFLKIGDPHQGVLLSTGMSPALLAMLLVLSMEELGISTPPIIIVCHFLF